MKTILVAVLLGVAIASGQRTSQRKPEQQQSEPSSQTDADNGRDKRGFIITPLSALPASAVAPLLPYLRALSATPSAQLQADPQLSSILLATAPLAADRAVNDPVVVATPVAKVAAAAPVIAAPAKIVAPVVVSQPAFATFPTLPTASFFSGARLTALPSGYSYSSVTAPFGLRYPSVHSSFVLTK